MPDWRLELRLRKQLLAALAALWLVGVLAALLALREETGEVLDSALAETAQRLLILPEAALVPPAVDDAGAGIGAHDEYIVYQVFDAQGALRLRSHQAPAAPMAPLSARGLVDGPDWHLITLARRDGARVVQVAESRQHRREVLWEASLWLLAPLLLVLPLAALVLRRLLGAAFRTLEPSRAAIADGGGDPLQPLPLAGAPHELRPWLESVNSLKQRVKMLLEAERSFAAHAAHELRTPLAAARAQAQRLAQSTADVAQGERARALVRQLERITELSTRLLQRARIESGVALVRAPVALALLARAVADEFDDASQSGRLQLDIAPDAGVVEADMDALGIALRNLLDNALKHGGAQARVCLRVGPDALSVSDDGPGVAPAELARLVRPFERGTSAAPGSGLGLALVDTIARQSGAGLVLRSPLADGRGFEATLRFAPQA